MQLGKSIAMLAVGDSASMAKTIGEYDVYTFAGITGDFNPLHVNEAYARETVFGGRIAHGALLTGLAAGLLGTVLPGLGTIAIRQETTYLAPVLFGDTITVTVTVRRLDEKANRVTLSIAWVNHKGAVVGEGEVIVAPPREKERERLRLMLGL